MEKICNFCGTINDAHHSAACVNEQRQTNVGWHESHNRAIKEKWVQTPKELKERRERIATKLMARLMRQSMSCYDISDAINLVVRATNELIKTLDEVKE